MLENPEITLFQKSILFLKIRLINLDFLHKTSLGWPVTHLLQIRVGYQKFNEGVFWTKNGRFLQCVSHKVMLIRQFLV